MIQEYVLLLCRFEAITMQDYERFCLLKLSSSQHKRLVGISYKLGIRVLNTSFLWTDGNFLEMTCIKFLTISTLLLLLFFFYLEYSDAIRFTVLCTFVWAPGK